MGTRTRRTPRTIRPVMRAFSLIELVMVAAIIGILSAMVIPRFGDSIARHSVEGAARRIAADLNLARRRAMTASTPQTFRTNSTGYALVGMPHLDHPSQEYRVDLDRECHGAAWASVDLGVDPELIFNMYGVPDSAATLVVRVGKYTRTVTIAEETGRVEILE